MGLAAIIGSLVSGGINASNSRDAMQFQEHGQRHAYRNAAYDMEKAGLNRVLALGSPAGAPSPHTAPLPDLGDTYTKASSAKAQIELAKEQEKLLEEQQALARAQTTKTQTETMNMVEMLPVLKHQGWGSGEQSATQAELNKANQFLSTLEGDKQEVLKALYTHLGPELLSLVRSLKDGISSAKQGASGVMDLVKRIFSDGDSASSARDVNNGISDADAENIAVAVISGYEQGKIPASSIHKLSPKIRKAIKELRPNWSFGDMK